MYSGKNLRVYERIPFVSYLFCSVERPSDGKVIFEFPKCLLKNIGISGLFFESSEIKKSILHALLSGKYRLNLSLQCSHWPCFSTIKANLRWNKSSLFYLESNKSGFGVEFFDLEKAEKENIKDFILGQKLYHESR
ncbi:hypothetical protein AB834_02460 [PVC group bacterium (ex Bugula neritina AB1)]|nr:hypothetical protein AB834_02460 [PVC group bacterium (ex Bugula neritina AB1)]